METFRKEKAEGEAETRSAKAPQSRSPTQVKATPPPKGTFHPEDEVGPRVEDVSEFVLFLLCCPLSEALSLLKAFLRLCA